MSYAQEFLSKFRNGISQPNRYRAKFFLPKGVSISGKELGVNDDAKVGKISRMQNYFNSVGQIDLKCCSAQLPGRQMMTFDHRMNGAPFKIPYSSSYGPASLSFYADGTLDTRDYFDVWQSSVNNLSTNTFNFPDEYVSDLNIAMLDRGGNETYSVNLFEAWPVDLNEITLGSSQNDEITIVTVSLEYHYWQPVFSSSPKNGNVS